VLYLVRLTVPRRGSRREWEAIRGGFGCDLAAQQSPAMTGLRIDSELRRGRDYVRVVIVAAAEASDVAAALSLIWQTFRQAAGNDLGGWDPAGASAEVRPAGSDVGADELLLVVRLTWLRPLTRSETCRSAPLHEHGASAITTRIDVEWAVLSGQASRL